MSIKVLRVFFIARLSIAKLGQYVSTSAIWWVAQ